MILMDLWHIGTETIALCARIIVARLKPYGLSINLRGPDEHN